MIDVRNAIADLLDRHTLENVAEVTLRKQEQCATQPKKKPREKGSTRTRQADPSDGFLAVLLESKLEASHYPVAPACRRRAHPCPPSPAQAPAATHGTRGMQPGLS